jgi:glycosyltransferase involved in cell wall biosynthesis
VKFLFITTLNSHWGGSEWLWVETASRLLSAGHEVAFFLPWEKSHHRLTALHQAGARRYTAAIPPTRWYRRWLRGSHERSILKETVDLFAPDLVVVSQGRQDEGSGLLPVLRPGDLPYVILNQQITSDLWLPDDLADQIVALFNGARRVFFVAEANRVEFEMQFGVRLPGSRMVRNPFRADYDHVSPWPDDQTLRLGLPARLDPNEKGQDLLLQVLAGAKWRDRDLHVHFFGGGSAERRLKRTQDMLQLSQVTFEGFAEDVSEIWRRCHVVTLPSRHEGMPIAMVEGMLSGRPVLGTKVGGIPELVEDGISGFLAEAPTPVLLDAALDRLWANRSRLREMGVAAHERARQVVPRDPAECFAAELENLVGSR